jgi:hypothetical protein
MTAFIIPSPAVFPSTGFSAMVAEAQMRLVDFFRDQSESGSTVASEAYSSLMASNQKRRGARMVAEVTGAPAHVAVVVFMGDLNAYHAAR